jgi:ubiquitin-activating enzyme E1
VLRRFSVVVATRGSHAALMALDAQCRSVGVPFIAASARGLCASVFCDFGAPRADAACLRCAR